MWQSSLLTFDLLSMSNGQGDERYNPPLFPPLNSPFERMFCVVKGLSLGRPLPLTRGAFLCVSWRFFRGSPTRKSRLTGRFRKPLAVLPFRHFVIPHGHLSRPCEREGKAMQEQQKGGDGSGSSVKVACHSVARA